MIIQTLAGWASAMKSTNTKFSPVESLQKLLKTYKIVQGHSGHWLQSPETGRMSQWSQTEGIHQEQWYSQDNSSKY